MDELVKIFVGLVQKGMSRRIVMKFCGVLAGSIKEYRNLHKEFSLALSKQRSIDNEPATAMTEDAEKSHETSKRGRKKKEVTTQESGQHDNS